MVGYLVRKGLQKWSLNLGNEQVKKEGGGERGEKGGAGSPFSGVTYGEGGRNGLCTSEGGRVE